MRPGTAAFRGRLRPRGTPPPSGAVAPGACVLTDWLAGCFCLCLPRCLLPPSCPCVCVCVCIANLRARGAAGPRPVDRARGRCPAPRPAPAEASADACGPVTITVQDDGPARSVPGARLPPVRPSFPTAPPPASGPEGAEGRRGPPRAAGRSVPLAPASTRSRALCPRGAPSRPGRAYGLPCGDGDGDGDPAGRQPSCTARPDVRRTAGMPIGAGCPAGRRTCREAGDRGRDAPTATGTACGRRRAGVPCRRRTAAARCRPWSVPPAPPGCRARRRGRCPRPAAGSTRGRPGPDAG